MRELVHMNLQEAYPAMRFIHADNGVAANEIIDNYGSRISLIVCDFNMPGGNGDIVFSKWQEKLFHIPFIMLTSEIEAARKKILKGQKNLWQRLSFQEKSGDFESLPKVMERLVSKSYIKVPHHWFIDRVPLNYPLFLALSDKKIIQYAHSGEELDLNKIKHLSQKGAKAFLIPMKEVLNKGLSWPHLEVQSHNKLKAPSLLDTFDSFMNVHKEVLLQGYFKEQDFLKVCSALERDLERFVKTEIFKLYNEKGLTLKNYVLNHSFLICLIANMALKELDLGSSTNRRFLLEGILFHDLFKSDEQAYKDDLLKDTPSASELTSMKNSLLQVLSVANDYDLSSDTSHIIEALYLHRSDYRGSSSNHKLARIARTCHLIATDLYKESFLVKISPERLKSYEDDNNLTTALGQIFV